MELQNLLVGLIRRKVLLAIAALLGLALGGLYQHGAGRGDYQATASLLLDPNAVTTPQQKPFTGDPERYVSGQLRLLASEALAAKAAERVPGATAKLVVGSVSMAHVVGTDLVDVSASASSARRARDIANALAGSYVDQRRLETKGAVADQLSALREQIVAVEAELAKLSATKQNPQRDVLISQYQQLIAQQSTLAGPGVTQDATAVIDPAVLPAAPDGLPLLRTLLLGLLLGLAMGVATAVTLEARAPHVGSVAQVERTTGLPVLASFPRLGRLRGRAARRKAELVARVAASVLMARPHESKPRVVALAGLGREAPPPALYRALLAGLREQGVDAILVDLRDVEAQPERRTARDLGPGQPGQIARRPLPDPGQNHLPTGAGTPGGSAMREELARAMVDDLPSNHEVVLLALPAVLQSPLAVAASRWVDDVIVLVDVRNVLQHELEMTWPLFTAPSLDLHVVTHS